MSSNVPLALQEASCKDLCEGNRSPASSEEPSSMEVKQAARTKKSVTFSFTDKLHPEVQPFRPGVGAISFLNNDSEPDLASHKKGKGPAANIGKALRPIGSGSPTGSNKSIDYLHEGLPFSTAHDINLSGSRYVAISNVPVSWDPKKSDHLKTALKLTNTTKHALSYAFGPSQPGDNVGTMTLYIFFNDFRSAKVCLETFHVALTTAKVCFVDHHTYFTHDPENPRASHISAYDGQIEFSTTFLGPTEAFVMEEAFDAIRILAASYGEIRSMCLIAAATPVTPRFRVEYWSIQSADKACEPGDLKENYELSDALLVTIHEYSPEGYGRYMHPAASAAASAAESQRYRDIHAVFNGLALDGPEDRIVPPPRRNAVAEMEDQRPKRAISSHAGERRRTKQRAPEYRNYVRHPNYSPPPPSPMYDLIDYDTVRRSGDKDVYIQPQMVLLRHIREGIDCRTTVMIRNIPNRLTAVGMKAWLDQTSHGHYDFSYLRVDFSNDCNVGYAFVNFCRPEHIIDFVEQRVGKPWGLFNSEKTCEISYATCQGQDCLITKFRNSSVMKEWSGYQPKLFYAYDNLNIPAGKQIGDQAPFPGPDNMSKLDRSILNAQQQGLYRQNDHSTRGRMNVPSRRSSQYDRGTPRAIMEEAAYNAQQNNMFNGHQVNYHQGRGFVPYTSDNDTRLANGHHNRGWGGRRQQQTGNTYRGGNNRFHSQQQQYSQPDDSFYWDGHDDVRNAYGGEQYFEHDGQEYDHNIYYHTGRRDSSGPGQQGSRRPSGKYRHVARKY